MDNKAEAAELAAIQRANVLTIEATTELANALAQNTELRKKLGELEEQIAGGIRVYVEYGDEHEMFINETAVSENMKNATLILDKGGGVK